MKKRLWFKAKNYGWGWYPVTWQGWVILLFFILLVIGNFIRIDRRSHSVSDTLINFVPQTFILIIFLLIICYKTGEKPEWRWGK